MLIRLLLLFSLLSSSPAIGKGIAAPIGLELGKARCSDVERRLPKVGLKRGSSAWSHGPTLESGNVRLLEVEGLENVLAVCAKDDGRMLALALTFSKGGVSASNVIQTARQLDAKYTSVSRDLPHVGDATAQWSAANGAIELQAPHMSFSFLVIYWTEEGQQAYRRFRDVESRRQETKKGRQSVTRPLLQVAHAHCLAGATSATASETAIGEAVTLCEPAWLEAFFPSAPPVLRQFALGVPADHAQVDR